MPNAKGLVKSLPTQGNILSTSTDDRFSNHEIFESQHGGTGVGM